MNIFKNDRQKALEQLINDTTVKLALGLYSWHDRYYEVVPYTFTQKRHNWSQFIKQIYKNKTFMIREASDEVIKKYFPKVWSAIDLKKAFKLNPEIIKRG